MHVNCPMAAVLPIVTFMYRNLYSKCLYYLLKANAQLQSNHCIAKGSAIQTKDVITGCNDSLNNLSSCNATLDQLYLYMSQSLSIISSSMAAHNWVSRLTKASQTAGERLDLTASITHWTDGSRLNSSDLASEKS